MPSSFPQGAHTLPRNFTFHYHDGAPPKTPEPVNREERARYSPPPPPRDNFRLRRRRPLIAAAQRSYRAIYPPNESSDLYQESSDVVIPSIEVSDASTGFHHVEASTEPTGQLPVLAPGSQPYSPPKTPVAQIYGFSFPAEREDPNEDSSSQGESLTRPSTACSGFSDSSISSSLESFPSLGYNNSPKSDRHALFGGSPEFQADPMLSSPLQSYSKPVSRKQTWTQDMDDHLWITYMRYLQDPTHTPFKMLPGTAPPLGVCSRVVKEAKRTWRGLRTSSIPPAFRFARWGSNRVNSPDALNEGANGSATPLASEARRAFATWPRTDAATRKRLRDLCKRKPTLSAHYNRLMHARSPSPFLSSVHSRSTSLARELVPPPLPMTHSNSFSTRDMNISLVTSISSTMQPSHPLSQLTSDANTPRPRATTQYVPSHGRSPGHQKAQSVHLGFGINESTRQAGSRALASPFRPTHNIHPTSAESHSSLQAIVSGTSSGPSLGPPVELHQPVARRSMFKRPAPQELEDITSSEDPLTRQNHLMKELFGPAQPVDIGHRRVRSRGFSLGDMSGGSRLAGLFAPPVGPSQSENNFQQLSGIPNLLMPPPLIDRVARLGSPFAEKPHFNTFPRNFSLSGLEPAMEIHEDQAEIAQLSVPKA
jgi:hypothetical protein